ncbi:MAG: thioredoxin family protein [Gemmataceae bacterium]|nr:thioredoxin family protein [Gemmataceae bacterium]
MGRQWLFAMTIVAFGLPGAGLSRASATGLEDWIRNDVAKAQAEARKTGKPIFVTFRCEA